MKKLLLILFVLLSFNGFSQIVRTLSNVNNTADSLKPISKLEQGALAGKQGILSGTGFLRLVGTTASYDNTSYLPLTGGIIAGTLNVNSFLGVGGNIGITAGQYISSKDNGGTYRNLLGYDGGSNFYVGDVSNAVVGSQVVYSANAVQSFYTNGIERTRITQAGNIGIGNSNPLYKLDILGNARITDATNTGNLYLGDGTINKSPGSPFILVGGIVTDDIQTRSYSTNSYNVNGIGSITNGLKFTLASNTSTNTTTLASGAVPHNTNAVFNRPTFASTNLGVVNTLASNVYIDGAPIAGTNTTITNPFALYVNSGNSYFGNSIGLGTTNITQKLNVVGQGVFGSSGASYDSGDGFGSATRIGYSTSGDYGYIIANNTGIAGKNLILQPTGSGSNVGVGTLAPNYKLDVTGAVRSDKLIVGNTVDNGNILQVNGNANLGGNTTIGGNILLSSSISKIGFNNDAVNYYIGGIGNGMEYKAYSVGNFTFTSGNGNWNFTNGNVGIGNTAPAFKLDVTGVINSSGSLNLGGLPFAYNDGTYNRVYNRLSQAVFSLGSTESYYDNNFHIFRNSAGNQMFRLDGANSIIQTNTTKHLFGAQTDDGTFVQFAGAVHVKSSGYFDGNVGIGTTAPVAIFGTTTHINGATGASLNLTGTTSSGYLTASDALGAVNLASNNTLPLTFTVNSSEKLRITNAGSVGIGTTNPYSSLDVVGNIFTSVHGNVSEHDISEQTTRFIGHKSGNTADGFAGMKLQVGAFGAGGLNNGSRISFQTWANSISTSRDVMTINEYGNVGIGTTVPVSKLSILSTGAVANQVVMNLNNPYAYGTGLGQGYSTLRFNRSPNDAGSTGVMADISGGNENETSSTLGFLSFSTRTGATEATTERMRINSGGNVGIGTTTPLFNLHTTGTAKSDKLIVGTNIDNGNAFQLVGNATMAGNVTVANSINTATGLNVTGNGGFYNAANKFGIDYSNGASRFYSSGANTTTKGAFEFHTNSSDGLIDNIALAINNLGYVGIGTTTPVSPFHVKLATNQNIFFAANQNGAEAGTAGIISINDANSAYAPLGFYASKYNFGGGNLIVGSNVDNGNKLQVNGGASISGNLRTSTNISMDVNNNFIYMTDASGIGRRMMGLSTNNALYVGDVDNTIIGSQTVFSTNTNHLFYINGTEKARFIQNGNFGLSTTAPRLKMEISATTIVPTALSVVTADGSLLLSDGGNLGVVHGISNYNSSYQGYVQARNNTASSIAYNYLINPLGGNVGIGTTTPAATLDVNGTVTTGDIKIKTSTSRNLYDNSTDNVYLNARVLQNVSTVQDGMYIGYANSAGGSTKIFDGGSSNYLGVGSSTVSTNGITKFLFGTQTDDGKAAQFASSVSVKGLLNTNSNLVFGINNSWLNMTDASGINRRMMGLSTNNALYVGDVDNAVLNSQNVYTANLAHVFYVNGAEKARIAQNGFVGIGTTTPAATLDVNGSTRLMGSVTGNVRIITGVGATYAITATDYVVILLASPGSTYTVDVASASNTGRQLRLVNKVAGSQTLSQNYINLSGVSTNQLPANSSVSLIYDGTNLQQF